MKKECVDASEKQCIIWLNIFNYKEMRDCSFILYHPAREVVILWNYMEPKKTIRYG